MGGWEGNPHHNHRIAYIIMLSHKFYQSIPMIWLMWVDFHRMRRDSDTNLSSYASTVEQTCSLCQEHFEINRRDQPSLKMKIC